MKRFAGVAIASCMAAIGCSHDALMSTGDDASSTGSDGAAHLGDASAPGSDLAAFPCDDPLSAHAELNGRFATSPSVLASFVPFNCCDGAALEYVSMQLPTPIVLTWRHQVGTMPDLPATLDLAALPSGWGVLVTSGCGAMQAGCTPTDSYDGGFTGTLTVARNASGGYDTSVCLHASDAGGPPHAVMHDLWLWSPTVSTQ